MRWRHTEECPADGGKREDDEISGGFAVDVVEALVVPGKILCRVPRRVQGERPTASQRAPKTKPTVELDTPRGSLRAVIGL